MKQLIVQKTSTRCINTNFIHQSAHPQTHVITHCKLKQCQERDQFQEISIKIGYTRFLKICQLWSI